MNRVFKKNGKRPLNIKELNKAIDDLITAENGMIRERNYFEVSDRIEGNLCACSGHGRFELLPLDECLTINNGGGKRYMKCLKCNQFSHL